jgi:hypothetical protein
MTDPKPQLDHDGDSRPGGAKKPPAMEWIVTRKDGLIQVSSTETAARLRAGARLPTARDFKVAGIEQ